MVCAAQRPFTMAIGIRKTLHAFPAPDIAPPVLRAVRTILIGTAGLRFIGAANTLRVIVLTAEAWLCINIRKFFGMHAHAYTVDGTGSLTYPSFSAIILVTAERTAFAECADFTASALCR